MYARIVAVGVVGGLALLGCSHTHEAAPSPVASAQEQSVRLLDQAQAAQRRATDQEHRAEAAEVRVKDLRTQLAEAQTQAAQERTRAQELQREAIRENQRATQQASLAQNQALESQGQLAASSRQSKSEVLGTLSRRAGNELTLLRADDGRPLQLMTDENTRVRLNGQPVDLGQLQEGTQVRASYVPGAGLPRAVDIIVNPGVVNPGIAPETGASERGVGGSPQDEGNTSSTQQDR